VPHDAWFAKRHVAETAEPPDHTPKGAEQRGPQASVSKILYAVILFIFKCGVRPSQTSSNTHCKDLASLHPDEAVRHHQQDSN
jgi:hypothetical protein